MPFISNWFSALFLEGKFCNYYNIFTIRISRISSVAEKLCYESVINPLLQEQVLTEAIAL